MRLRATKSRSFPPLQCRGRIERSFSKDEILMYVTLYRLTKTIGSSMHVSTANGFIPLDQHDRRFEVTASAGSRSWTAMPDAIPRSVVQRARNHAAHRDTCGMLSKLLRR